ncbi:MAG: hypothetical protein DBP02_02070 [gamma proteobacterium symbiont of Ctena orbiculata]|nr:MAG: hypothetical protein DBP02_02070 [gamma proteobacterium symbiont of Ctena orbiculata]
MAGIKLKPADTWFSKCIRERAGWICEVCNKQYEENSQGLHCSHFWSRRHRATRWDADNAAAHCFGCHQRLGGNPIEFADWIEQHLGEARMEIVRGKAMSIVKIPKSEEKDIAKYYREEYERMRKLRAEGVTGRIEFESYF